MTSMAMAETEEEFIQKITREGVMADQMLQNANEKMSEFETYKYTSNMNIESKVTGSMEGEELDQTVNMVTTQEGIVQKPQKVYGKSITKILGMNEAQEQVSEILMEDGTMYMKMANAEKWIKMDLNPIMQETQKIFGKQDMGSIGLPKEQMELLGMYASFDEDAVIDGKEYYIINMAVDKDAFQKVYNQVMDKMMDHFDEWMKLGEQEQDQPEMDMEEFKDQMKEMMGNMETEVSYKFYVDKETKLYDRMDMVQTVKMNLGEMRTTAYTKADFKYYDFNKEVVFPTINPEDVQDMNQMNQVEE